MEQEKSQSTTYKDWSEFTWRLDEVGVDLCLDNKLNLKILMKDGLEDLPRDVKLGLKQFRDDLYRFVLETDLARANRILHHGPKTTVNKSSVFTD